MFSVVKAFALQYLWPIVAVVFLGHTAITAYYWQKSVALSNKTATIEAKLAVLGHELENSNLAVEALAHEGQVLQEMLEDQALISQKRIDVAVANSKKITVTRTSCEASAQDLATMAPAINAMWETTNEQ